MVGGGDNNLNYNSTAQSAATTPATKAVYGKCCMTPHPAGGMNTKYFSDDCSCFDLIACDHQLGYKAQYATKDNKPMDATDNTVCPNKDHVACSKVRDPALDKGGASDKSGK